MASIIVQEAASITVGDETDDALKTHSLMSIKLPSLEEIVQDHHGGGAIGAIQVGGLGFKALEGSFKLLGYDPQVMSQFGVGSLGRQNFTARGLLRNKDLSNKPIAIKAVLNCRMTKIEPDEFKRGDLLSHDHALAEIWRYQLFYDGAEKYFYDFLTSEWRVDGVDRNADERQALGLA